MNPEIQSFIDVYKENRDKQKQSYSGYNFILKMPGRKYYSEAKEVQRFCFEQYKNGKKQSEIAAMLGLKNACTVSYHIKQYTQRK